MSEIIRNLRQRRILSTAKRERLTRQLLNLLVETYPVAAEVMGVRPAPYSRLPEDWLRRDVRGNVKMVVIGGVPGADVSPLLRGD
jgi:hypothetical protein